MESMGENGVPVIKPGQGYLDDCFSEFVLSTLGIWKCLGATPNFLTFLGFVCTLICLWLFYQGSYWCIFFLFLRSYFDWADGQMARTTGPITTFGDYFDHLSDLVCFFGIVGIMYWHYKASNATMLIVLVIVFACLSYTGCLERNCKSCPSEGFISRFFGPICDAVGMPLGRYVDTCVILIITAIAMAYYIRSTESFHS